MNKWVTLTRAPQTSPDTNGFDEALSPAGVYASIQPLAPSGDGRTIEHLVTIRYHSQVTMDTCILFGTRRLFVKGFQNVAEHDAEMRLLCEEVIP